MQEVKFVIHDPRGLHVVPLGALVRTCCTFHSTVQFICKDGTLNGKDLPAMLRVALRRGESFTLRFNGQDENEAAAKLSALLSESL